jgi:hypothetical protein
MKNKVMLQIVLILVLSMNAKGQNTFSYNMEIDNPAVYPNLSVGILPITVLHQNDLNMGFGLQADYRLSRKIWLGTNSTLFNYTTVHFKNDSISITRQEIYAYLNLFSKTKKVKVNAELERSYSTSTSSLIDATALVSTSLHGAFINTHNPIVWQSSIYQGVNWAFDFTTNKIVTTDNGAPINSTTQKYGVKNEQLFALGLANHKSTNIEIKSDRFGNIYDSRKRILFADVLIGLNNYGSTVDTLKAKGTGSALLPVAYTKTINTAKIGWRLGWEFNFNLGKRLKSNVHIETGMRPNVANGLYFSYSQAMPIIGFRKIPNLIKS